MELAVNQALAAVVRQVVPVQIAEKIRLLTLQNENLLEVLDTSEFDFCDKCYQCRYKYEEKYQLCDNCTRNYCPNCVESIIECSDDFCGKFCDECCKGLEDCQLCGRGFCKVCIEDCEQCHFLFCEEDFPKHPCQAEQ